MTIRTKKVVFSLFLALSLLLTLFLTTSTITYADETDPSTLPSGTFVSRIYYNGTVDIDALIDLNVDVHEYNNLQEKYVLGGMDTSIYMALENAGWQVEVDSVATGAFNVQAPENSVPGTYYGGYRTVDEIYSIVNNVNTANPTLTELVDYGDSWCKQNIGTCDIAGPFDGYDLLGIRIANEANAAAPIGSRPVFFLIAAIHSRELTTAEQALFYIDYLVNNYGSDADVTWMLDWHEVYIVPVSNPDGRYAVEFFNGGNPVSHRKNANDSVNPCGGRWGNSSSQPGIDLNRNWSYAWNTGGSSANPCSLTYMGPGAASEPEVSDLAAFVQAVIPDQRGPGNAAAPQTTEGLFVTMHSYSDLILYPWGNVNTQAPNYTGLKRIGDKIGAMTGYTSQQSINLYPTSGTTDDWSYGELGVPSYTYEIGGNADGFFPSYTTASTTHWAEVGESLEYAARIAHYPYKVAEGPDVDNLAVTNTGGFGYDITATVDDGQNGNQTISGAVYLLDTPPWVTGAISNTLAATDGNFNSVSEGVIASIDTCADGIPAGLHTIFVRAQDANGNWGPPWAEWLFSPGCAVPTAVSGLNGTIAGTSTMPILLTVVFTLLGLLSLTIVKRNKA